MSQPGVDMVSLLAADYGGLPNDLGGGKGGGVAGHR